jgi:hypothetical protein
MKHGLIFSLGDNLSLICGRKVGKKVDGSRRPRSSKALSRSIHRFTISSHLS